MKRYLGDSVYAEFDGFALVIYLNNGDGPFNRIVLEPEVFAALHEFVNEIDFEIVTTT